MATAKRCKDERTTTATIERRLPGQHDPLNEFDLYRVRSRNGLVWAAKGLRLDGIVHAVRSISSSRVRGQGGPKGN